MRAAARKDSLLKFTNLLRNVNQDCLTEACFNLKQTAAVGVDGVTWQECESNVEVNIADLLDRIQRGAYRVKPCVEAGFPNRMADSGYIGHRLFGRPDRPASGAVGRAEHL